MAGLTTTESQATLDARFPTTGATATQLAAHSLGTPVAGGGDSDDTAALIGGAPAPDELPALMWVEAA